MTDQARIDELLDQWEEAWEQGHPLSAAELCTEYPELTEAVATQIRALKATSWLNETDGEEDDFLSLPPELTKGSFSVPASLSLEELTSRIVASGLLTTQQLQQVEASSADDLATTLIRNRQLTEYQVEQICAGNTGKLVLGNYVILDVIGAGGMGEVFKARHTRMKRVVALKILPEKAVGSPTAVERFHREVEAAARLTHPHIVVAHDADEFEGTHFLVMEFVAGTDLSSLVKQRGPLPFGQAVDCIIQAARGLEYAHGEGVVHRDIKPANLLLNNKGKVKILDMGLARFEASEGTDGFAATQAELTAEGTVLGTVDYLAPEQALDTHQADARADIYSLGCTLYYLLTGRPLYSGSTLMAKMLAHREQEIPSMSDHRADVPDELAAIFTKMVAKQPTDRYPSMSALLADLESLAAKYAAAWQPESTAAAETGAEKTLADSPAHDTSSAGMADTLKFTPDPEPSDGSSTPPRTARRWLLAIATVAALLLGVIVIQTPDGTIRIETNQTNVEVLIDGEKTVYITDPQDQTKISVKIPKGAKTLRVTKAGFEADVKEFKLNTVKGPVKVSFVPVEKLPAKGELERDWTAREREVAKWVLENGGTVWTSDPKKFDLEGVPNIPLTEVNTESDLPAGPFWVCNVRLNGLDLTDRLLTPLKRLRGFDLDLHGSKGVSTILPMLSEFNLRGLILHDASLSDTDLKHVGALRQLRSLNLGYERLVTDTGMAHLSGLTKLRTLWVDNLNITDNGLAFIKDLIMLERLRIDSPDVTNAGLAHLSTLKNLKEFNCYNPSIGDDGIKHLQDLSQLLILSFRDSAITDSGVQRLSNLKNLSILVLSNCEITDASIPHLSTFKKLSTIDLTKTKVTAAGIADLQKSLPNCKITWDGNSSPERKAAEWVFGMGGYIFLEGGTTKIESLEGLSYQPFQIRFISVANPRRQIVADDLAPLTQLKKLVTVRLDNVQITDDGMQHLARLPNLGVLSLHSCRVSDVGLVLLLKNGSLPSLVNLSLHETKNVNDKHLQHLATRNEIVHLYLEGTSVTNDGLQYLPGSLMSLNLADTNISDDGLQNIKKLEKLQKLTLRNTKVTPNGIADLQQALPNCKITHRSLKTTDPHRTAAEWVISIGGSISTAAGKFTEVAKLPAETFQIDVVDLHNKRDLTDNDLANIKSLTKLAHLNLMHSQVTDSGLAHLKGMTNLFQLNVGYAQLKGPGLAHLQGMTKLQILNLHGTQIDDMSLNHLKGFTDLNHLELARTRVTDTGLETLAELTKLNFLTLAETQVSDAGLQHLQDFTKLRTLDLTNTSITDEGLKQLTGLKNLTTLRLSKTRVTAAGVAELQKALPKCKIESTPPKPE